MVDDNLLLRHYIDEGVPVATHTAIMRDRGYSL